MLQPQANSAQMQRTAETFIMDEAASAALVLAADGARRPERCTFCDLTDLSDDWGLLNHQTGGFVVAPARSVPPRPASENLHHSGRAR